LPRTESQPALTKVAYKSHTHPSADGLHLNLLQKIYNKIRLPNRFPDSHLPTFMQETLHSARCPSFLDHLENPSALYSFADRHQLTDLAKKSNRPEHTWFKKGIISQSSRIDMILTSVPISTLRINNLHTIFDHTFLIATLSPSRLTHVPPMKDFIIGSDEFLVREIEQIEQQVSLTSRPKHPLPNGNEQELHEDNQRNMPISKNRDFFNTTTGQTPLHSFSALIKSFPPCMMKSQKVQGIPGLTVQHASPARVNRPPAVYW